MLKYEATLKKIAIAKEKVRHLDEQITTLTKQYHYSHEELKNLDELRTITRIEIGILIDNARVQVLDYVLPIALDTYNKYEGKPIGPKTEEKINKEIKDLTKGKFSVHFHLENIGIIPLNAEGFSNCTTLRYEDFEIYTNYNKEINRRYTTIDTNNKAVHLTADMFHVWYEREEEKNPKAKAKKIYKEYTALKEQIDKVNQAMSDFGRSVPSRFNRRSNTERATINYHFGSNGMYGSII